MKTVKFYAFIITLVFITASCVERSAKYKAAIAQRDSLELAKQALDSSYNQALTLVNEIEAGFSEISQNENLMKLNLKGVEGSKQKAIIGAQMNAIKERIEKNKAKIAELQRLSSKEGKVNKMLGQTIKRLQTEMDEKAAQIKSLQAELEQKNIKISELNTTVSEQSKNIAEQQNVMEQQKSTISGQDRDLNTVWYCVATSKKLKEAKIITGGGLFQARKLTGNDFDQKSFTQVDLRNLSSIPTNSKKIKILTVHPKNSYNLVTGANKNITIEITNPSKFWSISKYLVVQI